ncbi:transcription elongation factor SPT4 [Cladochytrium replicatum]|nr:transcription elongation factor SPT4 [Cladochytrium replicatum]
MEDLPSTKQKLRACMVCGLVKNISQFKRDDCENCVQFLNLGGIWKYDDCTTADFEGIAAIINPRDSWVARWNRWNKFQRGIYALRVGGRLSDDIIADMKDAGFNYRPRDGTDQD